MNSTIGWEFHNSHEGSCLNSSQAEHLFVKSGVIIFPMLEGI